MVGSFVVVKRLICLSVCLFVCLLALCAIILLHVDVSVTLVCLCHVMPVVLYWSVFVS